MTVIAWDGKTLAADKRATLAGYGGGTVTKIHRINGALCAFSGSLDTGLEMLEWFRSGADPAKYPKRQADDNDATFIVITPDRAVMVYERSPHPLKFEEGVKATGSGRDYALAAMYLGYPARTAVEVACALDVNCGNGVDTLELE